MKKPIVHVIPNAHLDPVWLWDSREGLNEGVATCRTVLDLMDANPDLTFIRGEAAIYEHVRRTDPATFARIKALIRTGRWDPVGGSWIQPDTNLLESETLCRHYEVGQRWFRTHLGAPVTCGWQADSFGHTAGLPEVFAAAGIENFAFTRPPVEVLPLKTPAFWWRGRGGARILGYRAPVGWYGCERDEVIPRMDKLVPFAQTSTLRNIGLFIGLGNHGGGPSQKLVDDVRAWAKAHPAFEVRFGGLHSFFAALRRELAAPGAPRIDAVRGELNYCMRGCYASVARFKYGFRRAENELLRTERTAALLAHAIGLGLDVGPDLGPATTAQAAALAAAGVTKVTPYRTAAGLTAAWESVLFNSFHDILPGSSIERAFDEQIDEVGGVRHAVRKTAFHALNQLAGRVRVTLPRVGRDHPRAVPFLLWNPHLRPVRTFIELETCLDHRPIWAYHKRAAELPVEVRLGGQVIATEHLCFPELAWRKRVVVPVTLPAAGWNVASLGWVEGGARPTLAARTTGRGRTIRNDFYTISAPPGATGLRIRHRGRDLFGPRGLHLVTVADNWGSWGAMAEEPAGVRLTQVIGRWRISRAAVIESGPLRATLAVRFTSAKARVELLLRLCAGVEEVAVESRVFTDLESARIKLVLPGARSVECEVPAERVTRRTEGEIPVLRWLRARGDRRGFAVASDVLAAYDLEAGDLRVTLARATRYACDTPLDQMKEWWRPVVDRGELRARLSLLPANAGVEAAAELLHQPPLVQMTWANPAGDLPPTASLASLTPDGVQLLALKPAAAAGALEVRLRNPTNATQRPVLRLGHRRLALGPVTSGEVATFRIGRSGQAKRIALGAP